MSRLITVFNALMVAGTSVLSAFGIAGDTRITSAGNTRVDSSGNTRIIG